MVGRPGQAQVMSGAGPGLVDVLTLDDRGRRPAPALAARLLPEPGLPLAPGAADGQQGPGRAVLLQPPRDRRAERGGHLQFPGQEWPSRVWMRTREHLADEIMHACALTYISDMFTGLASVSRHRSGGP